MAEHIDYQRIQQLTLEMGRPAKTLCVQDLGNDPFYAGSPGRLGWAKWFAEIWRQFNFGTGVHIRRIHYRMISTEEPIFDINGVRYINNVNCWSDLKSASRDARLLGLVPIEAFVDQRADAAVIHLVNSSEAATLSVEEPILANDGEQDDGERADAELFFRPVSFDPACSSSLPDPPDYEFSPATIDEGFHVEIWCEKTTMADVLLPLAGQYRLNVVMGAGDLSLTHCHQFLQRARESGRAVRVLYVSDFDPSGRGMPVSVASKIAFLNQGLGLDIQVRPVALTHDQCVEHRLPRTPIKETAHGKDKFEERFGTGATELDALEALHPGLLRQILVQEIERYQDDELDDLVEEAANEFQERLDDARQNVLDRHEAEIEALRSRHRDISRDYRAEAEEVVDRCNAELAEIVGRCNAELAPIVEKYQPEIAEITEKYNVFQRNHRCRTGRRGARRRRNRVAGAGRGRRGSRPVIRLDPGLRHPD